MSTTTGGMKMTSKTADEELSIKARQYVETHECSLSDAIQAVLVDNKDLAERYLRGEKGEYSKGNDREKIERELKNKVEIIMIKHNFSYWEAIIKVFCDPENREAVKTLIGL